MTASGDGLLLDTKPVPVLVEVDTDTGQAWLTAMLGTVPGSDGNERLRVEYLEELSYSAADVLWTEDEIRMVKALEVPIYDYDSQTLALMVRGMASIAAHNIYMIDEFDLPLIPSPTYEEILDASEDFEEG